MIIKPKYHRKILSNPLYSGIIVGNLISMGFSIFIFIDMFFGFGLISIGVIYYYQKNKEFGINDD